MVYAFRGSISGCDKMEFVLTVFSIVANRWTKNEVKMNYM